MNEFMANALLSVLAFSEEKGYPILRLKQQYRMVPAVAKFFYKGQLATSKSHTKNNRHCQIARYIYINITRNCWKERQRL